MESVSDARSRPEQGSVGESREEPPAPFARAIGHTRFVVLIGVVAVLLIAAALFVYGAGLALWTIWLVVQGILAGQQSSADITVEFLEIVSAMLKAVVFYLVGVGLYSLFIAPLNLPVALGVETLNDLESKIVSVIVVIMAITFLERFIQWQQATEILQFGIAFSLVTAALVLYQWHAHRSKEELVKQSPAVEQRAHRELFSAGRERRSVDPKEYDALGVADGHTAGEDAPPRRRPRKR